MLSCSHWGLFHDPFEDEVQAFIAKYLNYLAYVDHYDIGHFDRLIDFDHGSFTNSGRDVVQT